MFLVNISKPKVHKNIAKKNEVNDAFKYGENVIRLKFKGQSDGCQEDGKEKSAKVVSTKDLQADEKSPFESPRVLGFHDPVAKFVTMSFDIRFHL